jgi:hypothetical protein
MADAPTTTTQIDRLILQIPGTSADDGRRVAELVVAGLANASGLPQGTDLPTLRITVSADSDADPETLARRIVEATIRELARTP